MAEIEVEGKTVEDAIREGLAKLGCSRDKVEIKILNEGTSGLFGLMGTKPARVLLTTRGEGGEKRPADPTAVQARAKEVVSEMLKLMHMDREEIVTSAGDDQVLVEVKSKDSSLLIGKNGQTLDALEHVLNLILNKDEVTRGKVVLDTEKYRHHQEERLVEMARKAAETVTTTKKAYRFDPMPAKERRVIHLALKDNPDVETFSEGDGMFRKVGVKPRNKK
ncbi:MAG: RNA-binding cell elongation regulator Jag/EloR [Endomicrobiales bacterium]